MPNVSCSPKDFVQGGLISDIDVLVEDIRFTLNGPPNYGVPDRIFAKAQFKNLSSEEGESMEQWWACGSSNDFTPTDDEMDVNPVSGKSHFTKGSNWHVFLDSLERCGFPVAKLETVGIASIKGAKMHIVRTTVKREGLSSTRDDGREQSTVVCSKLISISGEKAVRVPKVAAAPKPAAAQTAGTAQPAAQAATQPAAAAIDLDELARKCLAESITSEGGMLPKATVRLSLFQKLAGQPADVRNQVGSRVVSEEWLMSNGFGLQDGMILAQ
jgi:hypothetical protein